MIIVISQPFTRRFDVHSSMFPPMQWNTDGTYTKLPLCARYASTEKVKWPSNVSFPLHDQPV